MLYWRTGDMPFKYVDEEKTAIALDENKLPIWKHEDGQEVPVNFAGTLESIRDLSSKNKEFKTKLSEYEKQLKNFEGIDPEKSRKAIDIMSKLDEGKLVDSGKRDEAIQKAIEAKDAEWTAKHQSIEKAFNDANETLKNKDATIFNLMVSQKFTQSDFLNKQTSMTPDVAAIKFGQNYKIEDVDGKLKPVAYYPNGEKIYSLKNPGKVADFDESFQALWQNYEYKENYMKDTPGGPGSRGAQGSGNSRDIVLNAVDSANPVIYRKALEQTSKTGGQVILTE